MGQVGRQEDSLKLPFLLKNLKLFENLGTLRKIEQNNGYIRLSLLNFGFKIKTKPLAINMFSVLLLSKAVIEYWITSSTLLGQGEWEVNRNLFFLFLLKPKRLLLFRRYQDTLVLLVLYIHMYMYSSTTMTFLSTRTHFLKFTEHIVGCRLS